LIGATVYPSDEMSSNGKTSAAKAVADLQNIAEGGLDVQPIALGITELEGVDLGQLVGEDVLGGQAPLLIALKGLGEIANGESEGFRELKQHEAAFRKRFDAILKDLPELSEEDEAKLPPVPDYVRGVK
jgi:hypothetical protein